MPLYENQFHAENIIQVSEATKNAVVFDREKILGQLADSLNAGQKVAADGWYGVDWKTLAAELAGRCPKAAIISANRLFAEDAAIDAYKKTFITDAPPSGTQTSKEKLLKSWTRAKSRP